MPDTNKKELRYLNIEETRAVEDNGKRTIGGYAAVFWKYSEDLGGFKERIAKGAFKDSVASDDIRSLWNHNFDILLGRTRSNTLRLFEDDFGLGFDLDLPDTSAGRDTFELVKRGDVSGVSFGFTVNKETWEFKGEDEPSLRTLLDIKLYEISPTPFPAYTQTQVGIRSFNEILQENLPKPFARRAEIEARFAKSKYSHLKNKQLFKL